MEVDITFLSCFTVGYNIGFIFKIAADLWERVTISETNSQAKASRADRVLVIALAEATMDLMGPWAGEGRLPTIRRLMQRGTHGRLRSQIPVITPQMWGTIVTGRSPGHHGIFDFWQRGSDGRFLEVHGRDIRAQPIWSVLSARGRPAGVLNVPFTFPPTPIDGFMISGEDAPGSHPSIATPAGIYREVVDRFGRYPLKDIFPGGRKKSDYLTLISEDVPRQTDAFEYLLATKPWDFGLVFYSATAIAQHYFWSDMTSEDPGNPYRNVIEAAYRSVDDAIRRLVEAAGPDTQVFVISECGAGPLRYGVHLDKVLEDNGLLKRKPSGARSGSRSFVRKLRQSIQSQLNRPALDSLYYWANVRLGGVKSWIQSYLSASDIDWTKTRAFSRGKEGDIFINLAGRDPHGIVQPGAEYEDVCHRVTAAFEALVDPESGESAVARVHRREDLYSGPMLEFAPDLVIEWRDCAYEPTESEKDRDSVFVERWREYMDWPTSGSHRMEGVLVASGPGIRQGGTIAGARIIDLAPTWLAAMGESPPADLEGEVLEGLFETSRPAARAADSSP
jgi:predicted AlkP superfamily phosphohydrolase/phosphomutase